MHSKAITTQEELTRAAELVGEAMDKAEQRLSQAEAYVRPIEQVVKQIEETVRDSGTAIQTAVENLADPLTQAGRQLTDAVGGQTSVLDKALEDLRAAGDAMRDLLVRAADRLESAVGENGDRVRTALSDAAQQVEDSLTVLAASQRGFTTGIEVVSDVNGRLLSDLGTVAERSSEAAEISREALLGIEARSQALHLAADRFTHVTDALVRALSETESARADVAAARADAEAARAGAEAAQRRAEDELRQAKEWQAGIGSAR
jgi:chromosome segregation ATPase